VRRCQSFPAAIPHRFPGHKDTSRDSYKGLRRRGPKTREGENHFQKKEKAGRDSFPREIRVRFPMQARGRWKKRSKIPGDGAKE